MATYFNNYLPCMCAHFSISRAHVHLNQYLFTMCVWGLSYLYLFVCSFVCVWCLLLSFCSTILAFSHVSWIYMWNAKFNYDCPTASMCACAWAYACACVYSAHNVEWRYFDAVLIYRIIMGKKYDDNQGSNNKSSIKRMKHCHGK